MLINPIISFCLSFLLLLLLLLLLLQILLPSSFVTLSSLPLDYPCTQKDTFLLPACMREMWSVSSCRNCSVRGIHCDGGRPACTPCTLSGATATTKCAQENGPGDRRSGATDAATTAGRSPRSGAAENRWDHRSLVKRSSFTDTVPESHEPTAAAASATASTPLNMTMDPVPSQYRETQLIFDGINYCTVIPAPVPRYHLFLAFHC